MQTEFEVKFCDVDFDDIRSRLAAVGATCTQPMRLMRRYIFEDSNPSQPVRHTYLRLRDEGHKTTLTLKHFSDVSKVGGAHENEVVVSSFDEMYNILSSYGIKATSYQESRRETWELDGGEVVLDEWPWLKPYIEVEADSEDAVKAMCKKLGLNWADIVVGDVVVAYRLEYDIAPRMVSTHDIRFDDPRPDWMKPKKDTQFNEVAFDNEATA